MQRYIDCLFFVCFSGFFFRFFSRLCLSYMNSPDNFPNNFFYKHPSAQSHTCMLRVFIAILSFEMVIFFFIFLKIFISLSFLLFSINFIREDFGFPRPTHFPSSNLVSLFFFFSFYSYIFLMKIIVSSRNDIWEGLCNHIDSL